MVASLPVRSLVDDGGPPPVPPAGNPDCCSMSACAPASRMRVMVWARAVSWSRSFIVGSCGWQ